MAEPIELLANMVAASDTFCSACGVGLSDPNREAILLGQQAGELQRIWYPEADPEQLEKKTPLAVIQWPDGWLDFKKLSGGAANYLRPHGTLTLTLALADDAPLARHAGATRFSAFCSNVLQEIAAQAAVNDELAIEEITSLGPDSPSVDHEASLGFRYWMAGWVITWS
jgi:hypothetical protein